VRRGLTVIEILLALALLTALAAATLPLTRSSLDSLRETDRRLLWQRSAEMALGEIDRLLLQQDRRGEGGPVVVADGNRLRTRLTGGKSASIEHQGGILYLSRDDEDPRVLVGDVAESAFELDEELERLTVTLKSVRGQSASRSWELEP